MGKGRTSWVTTGTKYKEKDLDMLKLKLTLNKIIFKK